MRPRGDRLHRFVETLLRDRRPPRFEAGSDEARVMRVAAALRGARPAGDLPREEFITGLERRLRDELDRPASAARPSRRGFIVGGGIAAAGVAAGIGVEARLRGSGPASQQTGELVPSAGSWQQVATVADLADGRPRRFRAGAVEGVLVPRAGGAVHAVSAVCTHMGCLLGVDGVVLRCPCHDATFSLEGQPLDGEYRLAALATLRCRVVDGRVEVLVA